jgi:hypothetical protein
MPPLDFTSLVACFFFVGDAIDFSLGLSVDDLVSFS